MIKSDKSALAGLLCGLALLSACSGASRQQSLDLPPRPAAGKGTLSLRVLPESFIDGGSAELRLSVEEADDRVIARVTGSAQKLKALYIAIDYPAQELSPLDAKASGLLSSGTAGGAELLELAYSGSAGILQHGQVLAHWDRQAGFSGEGCLASFAFARKPFSAVPRRVSTPPLDESSSSPSILTSSLSETRLIWFIGNTGDYNMDGLVSISDLTPLGLRLGAAGDFSLFSALSQIDGDGNGEINISDLTPIGANFGNSVNGGYNIYRSFDPLDYPASAADASVIAPFASEAFANLEGDPAVNRIGRDLVVLPGIVNEYFWVRPLDSAGTEGIAGTLTLCPAPSTLELALVTPAISGAGTEPDPYVVSAGSAYELTLTHGVDGDVTDSPFSFIDLALNGLLLEEEEVPASWDAETKSVIVNVDGTGEFHALGAYGSDRADDNLYFRIHDPDNIAPTASFSVDVSEGTAPFNVTCNASTSSDSDGFISRFEWDLDGDAVFETETSFGSVIAEIETGGEILLGLRTVDDDEAVSTVFTQLVRSEGWVFSTVGDAGDETAPAAPVLRVANGKPLIAYRSHLNLNMAYSGDSEGSSWSASSMSDAFTPQQISMEIINGNPALAWRRVDSSADGIYYSRSVNADGLGFGDRILLQSGGESHSPSLAEIDGRPALAYAWHSGAAPWPYSVFYIRASDADGDDPADWDLIGNGQSLFSASELYLDSASLQKVDTQIPGIEGRPGIFFISVTDELMQSWVLRFIKAENNAHTEWTFPSPLQAGGAGAIGQLSICSIVSRPRFVYQNTGSQVLSYRTCSDLAAESWGSLYGIGDAAVGQQRGFQCSLANIAGFPALLHYDALADQLRFVSSSEATGEGGWNLFAGATPVVADVGHYDVTDPYAKYVSLYALAGQPAMAYHDTEAGSLIFARFHRLD